MTRSKLAAIAMVLALALPFAGAAEDAPGTWRWGDTTLKLYGYVQLDTTFDFLSRVTNAYGHMLVAGTAIKYVEDAQPAQPEEPPEGEKVPGTVEL
jgi:hypothetical protein